MVIPILQSPYVYHVATMRTFNQMYAGGSIFKNVQACGGQLYKERGLKPSPAPCSGQVMVPGSLMPHWGNIHVNYTMKPDSMQVAHVQMSLLTFVGDSLANQFLK